MSCCDLPLLGLARRGPTSLTLSLVLVPGGTYSIEALEAAQSESEREYFFDKIKIEARRPETRSGNNKKAESTIEQNDIACCRCSNEG